MELVYPIYLDVLMMSAFLASLEGGLVEEKDVETKSQDAKEKSAKASLAAKVSGLLSSVLSAEAAMDLARTVSESLESQSKSTVRFPSASLFIRLRNILVEQEMVKLIHSSDDIDEVVVGDLVELEGAVSPNPAHQIRRSFTQLLPLLEAYTKLAETQLEQQLLQLKDAKPGKSIQSGGQSLPITDTKQVGMLRENVRMQQQQSQAQAGVLQMIGSLLEGLLSSDAADLVVFGCPDFRAVCRVYPALSRSERLQDMYDADWRCIGKVIRIIKKGESFDLLKGTPISYMAQSMFPTLAAALNNENLRVETTEPVIQGPALVLATLAIFA